jgi:hypothetical protein
MSHPLLLSPSRKKPFINFQVFFAIPSSFIPIVKKRSDCGTLFLLQPLILPSFLRNAMMTSGIDRNNSLTPAYRLI